MKSLPERLKYKLSSVFPAELSVFYELLPELCSLLLESPLASRNPLKARADFLRSVGENEDVSMVKG